MSGTSGADRYGFNPFPGQYRFPGGDAVPGPMSSWLPLQSAVMDAYRYATERFIGLKDKTCLNLLAQNGIGDHT